MNNNQIAGKKQSMAGKMMGGIKGAVNTAGQDLSVIGNTIGSAIGQSFNKLNPVKAKGSTAPKKPTSGNPLDIGGNMRKIQNYSNNQRQQLQEIDRLTK